MFKLSYNHNLIAEHPTHQLFRYNLNHYTNPITPKGEYHPDYAASTFQPKSLALTSITKSTIHNRMYL